MGFIKSAIEWFSAQRRQAIYVAVASIVPVLVLIGTLRGDQTEHVLTLVSVSLQIIAGLLALFNLSAAEAGEWFVTAGRAAIYGLAVLAAPAAVGLGWLTADDGANVLTIVSVGLTVLGSIIGVVHIKPDPQLELVAIDLDQHYRR